MIGSESQKGDWQESEAQAALDVLRPITADFRKQAAELARRLDAPLPENEMEAVEQDLARCVGDWSRQVQSAGARVHHLWQIAFPNSAGYYLWRATDDSFQHVAH